MTVVEQVKPDGSVKTRLCLDPIQTINNAIAIPKFTAPTLEGILHCWARTSTSASQLLTPWMDLHKFLSVKSQALSLPCTRHAWPAIFDICLGTRMVPVLSVAKESPAPAARALAARCGRAQCFLGFGSASVHVKQADRSRLERSVRFSSCRCKLLFSEQ